MTENEIAAIVVDSALKVHRILGPGLLESVYKAALKYELEKHGIQVAQELPVAINYETVKLDLAFRLDLLLDERVIVEIKSVEVLLPVHRAQLLTYLRLMDLRLGLLINFNVELVRDGIKRVVNGLA